MGKRILIIKLGAKGDVIRTLPILIALKEKYTDSEINWITKPNISDLIRSSPYLNKVYTTPDKPEGRFDMLYNFDIDEESTTLASQIPADQKYGFYKQGDYVFAFNFPAENYLNILFDDLLKKENQKTYQEMIFEVAELSYKKQHHEIYLTQEDKEYAKEFIRNSKIKEEKLIGIHIGSSPRWPSKAWHEDKIKEFIKKAREKGYELLLFGGPDDIEKHLKLVNELNQEGIKIYKNNPENTDKEFVSLVNLCKVVISSDSLALHVAIALKKPTIVLFFCTSPNEIEDYGFAKKITSPLLYDFFPEKMDQYSEELVNSISVGEVLKVLESLVK